MPLPDPLYVLLKDGSYFRVDHADSRSTTVTDIAYKPGVNYRDEIGGGYLGGMGSADINTAVTAKDDRYGHTAPHAVSLSRSEYQWVSAARHVTGTTTSGSTALTVSSTEGLAVGWALSGTGIPANSFIQAMTSTSITMSMAATASGTVDVTVGGTYVLASCWVDEYKGYAAYPPQQEGRTAVLWPS